MLLRLRRSLLRITKSRLRQPWLGMLKKLAKLPMSTVKKMARKKRQRTKKPKMRTYPMKKRAVPSSTTTRKRRMKTTAVSTKDHDVISNYTL